MTYGIPHHLIPYTVDGKIKTKNHLEFIETRKTGEEYAKNGAVETIELPKLSDILCEKGKVIQESCGNLRLQAIVDEYVHRYHSSSKAEKTALAEEVVRMVKSASGRFLTKESGIWIETTDEVAREKVSHLFRARRHLASKSPASPVVPDRHNVRSSVVPDFGMNKRIKV